MPYREVTMVEVKEVLRRWLAGAKKKRIGAELGLDPKTVRRYVTAAVVCGLAPCAEARRLEESDVVAVLAALRGEVVSGRPRGGGWQRCQDHRDFIERHLTKGVRLSKITKLLRRHGVEVPYWMLYRYAVAELGFGKTAPTIPVADGEPGGEVQVDTGWMPHLEPDPLTGKRRRFRAWIFTPVVSRYRFVFPCLRETTESSIEACEAAWSFYGGVFHVVIVDNTKAIVQEADPLTPRLSPTFLEYAQARGFHLETTRVRSPKDKARVERTVSYVRDDCFGGERIGGIDEARERAQRWSAEEAGLRRHATTQRLPREHFETVEKAHLLAAPESPYDVPIWAEPKVARDQHAQVARALYSLPTRFVGRRLRARADRSLVRFYEGMTLVKTHPRKPAGGRSTDAADFPEHKTAYALRDVAALQRQAARYGEETGRFAARLLDSPLPWTRMRAVYALLGLVRRFGEPAVEEACRRALAVEMLDVHRLRRMLESAAAPTPAASPSRIIPLQARYLRPASQYRLALAETHTHEGDNR